MGGLISVFIWFGIVWYIITKVSNKKPDTKGSQPNVNRQPVNRQNQTLQRVNTLVRENVTKLENQAAKWMEANGQSSQGARPNAGTARPQTANNNRSGSMPSYMGTPKAKQTYNAAAKAMTPDIVQRAKANAKKYETDETLHELESEHKHSERVSTAEAAYVAKDREAHMKMHTQPTPVEEENLLGSVEDLMVKGYDGNLSFERDFLGEAMDMINRFTLAG